MKKLILTLAVSVFLFTLLPNKAISALSWEGFKGKIEALKAKVKTKAEKLKLELELNAVRDGLRRQRNELAKARSLESTRLESVSAREVRPMAKAYASILERQIRDMEHYDIEIMGLLAAYS